MYINRHFIYKNGDIKNRFLHIVTRLADTLTHYRAIYLLNSFSTSTELSLPLAMSMSPSIIFVSFPGL